VFSEVDKGLKVCEEIKNCRC